MPGFLLHVNASLQCFHAAPATIAPAQPRVVVSGQFVAPSTSLISVVGCLFAVGPKPQPCVLVKWLMPSTRFVVAGQPVALVPTPGPAPGICQSAEQAPQGAPVVTAVQTRVVGS